MEHLLLLLLGSFDLLRLICCLGSGCAQVCVSICTFVPVNLLRLIRCLGSGCAQVCVGIFALLYQ
jgi:hypothetical protein